MLDRDVGEYEAVATNEHGEARQRVKLEIAEYPEFIKRPAETIILTRRSGRIDARVIGVPYPEIKWYKDWQPIASSSRIKVRRDANLSDAVPNSKFIQATTTSYISSFIVISIAMWGPRPLMSKYSPKHPVLKHSQSSPNVRD
jgi:hypothetical protein